MIPIPGAWIAYAVAAALALGGGWWAKSSYDEGKREEGRAETQIKFDKYKANVIEATLAAQVEVLRVETELSKRGAEAVARHDARSNAVNQSVKDALNALNSYPPSPTECRLTDGMRDAVNTAIRSAARSIDDSYKIESGMRPTDGNGRDARKPRDPRS